MERQIDNALEVILTAIICTPLLLNAVIYELATQPAKWAAIREQCLTEGLYPATGGIDAMRLSRASMLDAAILERATAAPPVRVCMRMICKKGLRLGGYTSPRRWALQMILPTRSVNGDEGAGGSEGGGSCSGRVARAAGPAAP